MSSTFQSFDLLGRHAALVLYSALVPTAVLFLLGIHRSLAPLGLGGLARELVRHGNLRRLITHALLQRRMFQRPFSGLIHAAIFWGFLALVLGDVLLLLNGYLLVPLGLPLLRGSVAVAFQGTLDACGLVFLLGVLLALGRRLFWRPRHLPASTRAVLLLLALSFVAVSGFVLEGLRMSLEPAPPDAWAFVGSAVAGAMSWAGLSVESILTGYRALWWAHAIVALGLIAAVPYTELLHWLTAPIGLALSPPGPRGELRTPFELAQLEEMGRFDVKVGAGAIGEFDAASRWSFAACTNCGRCDEVCPAHLTGRPLAPRTLIQSLKGESQPERDLFAGTVSEDEVWSCTLCGACARTCPVLIDPLASVVELRRELVTRNRAGERRTEVLSNLLYAGNPYGPAGTGREEIAEELGVPTLRQAPDAELLYWIGCAATFDRRARKIAEAVVSVLRAADIEIAILGPEECCTGDPARRIGEEGMFQQLAARNIEAFNRYGVKKILTHCAHCLNALRNEYPRFGGRYTVVHHASLLRNLLASGRLTVRGRLAADVTFHDSCYVGRFAGETEAPRRVLRAIPGLELIEMERNRAASFCCGAGGANYWYDVPARERMSTARLRQAKATGADLLVGECPYCLRMFEEAEHGTQPGETLEIRDIAEVVAEAMA